MVAAQSQGAPGTQGRDAHSGFNGAPRRHRQAHLGPRVRSSRLHRFI